MFDKIFKRSLLLGIMGFAVMVPRRAKPPAYPAALGSNLSCVHSLKSLA